MTIEEITAVWEQFTKAVYLYLTKLGNTTAEDRFYWMKQRLMNVDLEFKKFWTVKMAWKKKLWISKIYLKMPEHENDTENNAKMDLLVNQKSDLESLNTLDLQKECVESRKILLIRDKEKWLKLFLEEDKKNVIRSQLMGYCLLGLKIKFLKK